MVTHAAPDLFTDFLNSDVSSSLNAFLLTKLGNDSKLMKLGQRVVAQLSCMRRNVSWNMCAQIENTIGIIIYFFSCAALTAPTSCLMSKDGLELSKSCTLAVTANSICEYRNCNCFKRTISGSFVKDIATK